jgi:rhodanese-related sulfurtransferase
MGRRDWFSTCFGGLNGTEVKLALGCYLRHHKGIFGQRVEQMVAMNKLKIGVAEMVAAARARITEVEVADLAAMADDPNVVIVDLRDIRERQRSGFIPGSFHAPRGMIEFWIDPDSPYFKPIFAEDKQFVFHCASGWRSALTTATLQDMGFAAAHLREGFSGWEKHGHPVERVKP